MYVMTRPMYTQSSTGVGSLVLLLRLAQWNIPRWSD